MDNLPSSPRNRSQKKESEGLNWLGPLIFLLVIGSQFVVPLLQNLSQFIGQNTAQQLSGSISNLLPFIIAGLVILAIVVPIIRGIFSAIGSIGESSSMPQTGGLSPTPQSNYSRYADLPAAPALPGSKRELPAAFDTLPRPSLSSLSSPLARPRGHGMDKIRSGQLNRSPNYKTPGFEPIIDGKVLAFGLAALVLIGGALLLTGWLATVLP
jgi:hypothetical protein